MDGWNEAAKRGATNHVGILPRARTFLGLAFALLLLLTAAALTPAATAGAQSEAQSDQVPASIDELFALFGVDTVPADFVVVVDTSGSMSQGQTPPYPAVLGAYRSLVDSIPEGDNLSVLTFDSSPNLTFQGEISSESREQAKAALPAEARGRATDIGSAIDATLRRLERADASDVQLVLFLTDGQHQPAVGSAYPGTSGPEWDALRARAQTVDASHDTLVLGVGLGDQGAGGIELLRQVFGNPEINSLPPEQLPDFFRESVRRSQVARLATLVNEELANGIDVTSSSSALLDDLMEVEVEITSHLEKLPVDVTIAGVQVKDANGDPVEAEIVGNRSLRIGPDDTATVTVRMEPPVEDPGFKVPPVTEDDQFDVTLDATYQVLPKDLLARVTATPTTGTVNGTHVVDASRTFGRTIREVVTVLGMLLLLALILLWLYRRFIQLPKLVGVFVVDKAVDADRAVIPLKGKKQRITAKDVPGAGGAKVELFTRRGKPKRVYARVETPPFFEVEDRRREKVITDETEIRVNRYRLGGGRMKYWPKAPERD